MAPIFATGDLQLDSLLEDARHKYLSHAPGTRRDALERLWDAFERLKTIEPGSRKPEQTAVLFAKAYPEPHIQKALDAEFIALSSIGNQYNIRHFETDRLALPDDAFVDYLFRRCYSAIYLVLVKTNRHKA